MDRSPPSGPVRADAGRQIISLVDDELVLDAAAASRSTAAHRRARSEVLFGTLPDSEEAVVVKLEGVTGMLARDRAALRYIAGCGGSARS